MHRKSLKIKVIAPVFLLAGFTVRLCAGQTVALFQPASLTKGPFPTNVLTVSDFDHKTHLRIDLPASSEHCDFLSSPAVCSNTTLLNQLDGFSVNPRLMVCFSAAVDPNTLASGIRLHPVDAGPAIT